MEADFLNKNIAYLQRQIAHWQAKSQTAGENGDYPAFQFAEREIANYREMLKDELAGK